MAGPSEPAGTERIGWPVPAFAGNWGAARIERSTKCERQFSSLLAERTLDRLYAPAFRAGRARYAGERRAHKAAHFRCETETRSHMDCGQQGSRVLDASRVRRRRPVARIDLWMRTAAAR